MRGQMIRNHTCMMYESGVERQGVAVSIQPLRVYTIYQLKICFEHFLT